MRPAIQQTLDFISSHWSETVRHTPVDADNLLGLPRPYTVPCRREMFQELYYWDTFYTNEGLIATGRIDLARDNTENILHLIGRFGFMPNGSHTRYLDRSQPPHAALMVRRVYETAGDRAWLARCLAPLVNEHAFWMTRRLAPVGLNHYGHHSPDALLSTYRWDDRLGEGSPAEPADLLRLNAHSLAECESGWDFTPRFDRRCRDFCPVDLNSLLFAHEEALAFFHDELDRPAEAAAWRARAEGRRALMRRHLWSDKDGAYLDFDYTTGRHAGVLSSASFYPVWLGVAGKAEARRVAGLLPCLEAAHGLFACEPGPRDHASQWDAPNGWPPLHYAAVHALRRAGLAAEAERVASKYIATVASNFIRTGDLWEKYNVTDGSIRVRNEYEMPAMLGWTAGVFAALARPPAPALPPSPPPTARAILAASG